MSRPKPTALVTVIPDVKNNRLLHLITNAHPLVDPFKAGNVKLRRARLVLIKGGLPAVGRSQ